MQGYVCITEEVPGLVPWGFFELMAVGVRNALRELPHRTEGEGSILSEGLMELFLDHLPAQEFNLVLSHIQDGLIRAPFRSERFDDFWNTEVIPLLNIDHRYAGVCRPLNRSVITRCNDHSL